MDNNFQDQYSRYYELLYKDKNYEAESDYVLQLIKTLNPAAVSILELGSGTARHAEFFCKADYRVTGIEQSAEMASIAVSKGIKGFTSKVGDIAFFNLESKFDVAVSLFHVISYLTTNEKLVACFRSVNEHLQPGGIFIFDVWYTPAVFHQMPEPRVKYMEDDSCRIIRHASPEMRWNENVVDVKYDIEIEDKSSGNKEYFSETHPMRHFSIPEIELLAVHTHFKLIRAEEFLTAKKPGTDTWGVCFILQKI